MAHRNRLARAVLLVTVATVATILLSLAAESAVAKRLRFSSSRFQGIWSLLTYEIEGAAIIGCPFTLEGSFHSASITKLSGLLVGYVTSAKVRGGSFECLGSGTARVNTESLPWHIRYRSFFGLLPNVTEIQLQAIGVTLEVDPAGVLPKCRVRTTAANPAGAIVHLAFGIATTVEADAAATIPVGGEFSCEIFSANSHFLGTGEVFVQGSTVSRITVQLIA